MLNTVCELLIKITYQHSVYKHQVGLLAIDPLLYLMEPSSETDGEDCRCRTPLDWIFLDF